MKEMEKTTQPTGEEGQSFEQNPRSVETDPDFSKIYQGFLADVPDDGRYLWEGKEPLAIRNVAIKELLSNFEQIARMSGVMTPDKREEVLNRIDSLAGEVYFLAGVNGDQSLVDRFESAKSLLPENKSK